MNLKRGSATLSLAAMAAATLVACGSDPASDSGSDAAAGDCTGKKSLTASGSSAQANAMTNFASAYQAACSGFTVNYSSTGSGAGVKDFTGGLTDFGGSDSPLSESKGEYADAEANCGSPAWNLPVVFGPIVVAYNLPGFDDIALDGATLGSIFSGAITKWNDPAIAALNTGVELPDRAITVIYRSDESGTTDNFQKYLEAASDGSWGKGDGKAFAGGVGEGATGNEGTSSAVKGGEGTITYNEWSFATDQGLQIARIGTSAGGDPVTVSNESVGLTIDGAVISGEGHDLVLDTSSFYKPTAAGAYPIVLATYEIVCSDYADDATAAAVKKFLSVTVTAGQDGLSENGYIPLPEAFVGKLQGAIDAIA